MFTLYKTFQICNGSSVNFYYTIRNGNRCPISVKAELINQCHQTCRWAVLQAFEEDINGKERGVKIDGPGWEHNCLTTAKRPNSLPPHYSSCTERFSVATAIFEDTPCYDCNKPGKLVFYTMFSELNESACSYEILYGLKWGIEMLQAGKIQQIPIEDMVDSEYQSTLKAYQNDYPNLKFVRKGIP